MQTAIDAMRGGAIDYITKPFTVGQFLQRIDTAVERWRDRMRVAHHSRASETLVTVKSEELSRTTRHIDEVYDMTVAALGAALNLKGQRDRLRSAASASRGTPSPWGIGCSSPHSS